MPRKIALWIAACTVLVAGEARSQSLLEVFEQVLNAAIHAPIPDAIAPLVTIAENADSIALAALEIAAGRRDRQIKGEYPSASRARQAELDRMEKANEEIKGKLAGIKAKRCAEEKKAKDDGWDPFHARMSAGGPVTVPGVYLFRSLDDGFADLPGDVPTGPICAIVTPGFAGYEALNVHVSACSMQVAFVPTAIPERYDIQVQDFGMLLDSFDIAPGTPTGSNHGALSPYGTPPRGEYDAPSGRFEIRFEGAFRNNLFPPGSAPMIFFATAFGGLDKTLGEALVGADDPMIVPMPPGTTPVGQPKVMGAHVIEYDAVSNLVRCLENTTLQPDADLAMVRNRLGQYIADPLLDPAVGSTMIVDPFLFLGTDPLGVHHFGNANLRIESSGIPILQGVLTNVELDPNCGDFFGDLQVGFASPTSPVLQEIGMAPEPKAMQLCSTPGGFDLVALTQDFTVSGTMPWPEIFHAGVLPAAVSDVAQDVRLPRLRVAPTTGDGPVRIAYSIAAAGTSVRLEIFDVAGRLVRTIESGVQGPGEYERTWEGVDRNGSRVGRGVYFVQLTAGTERFAERVVLARD